MTTEQVPLRVRLAYRLLYGLLYLLSLLPFACWYGVSNGLFWLVYRRIRYRRSVVRDNLAACFPDWDEARLQQTERAFYRHFCDSIVEGIKCISMTDAEVRRRVLLSRPELPDEVAASGRSVLLFTSHYGNVEYLASLFDVACQGILPAVGVYSPFRSPVFDLLLRRIRSRRGMALIPMRNSIRAGLSRMQASQCVFAMIIDQTPRRTEHLYFTQFLGRPTPFHTSAAYMALQSGAPVYLAYTRKLRRGYYQVEVNELDTRPYQPFSEEQVLALTDRLAAELEKPILEAPEYWLWSHRRWKHAPRPGDRRSVLLAATAPES